MVISMHHRAKGNASDQVGHNIRCRRASDVKRYGFTTPLPNPEGNCLGLRAPSLCSFGALVQMLVSLFSPQVGFVNFHFATKGFAGSFARRVADALKHIPGRALFHTDILGQLQTGYTLAVTSVEP